LNSISDKINSDCIDGRKRIKSEQINKKNVNSFNTPFTNVSYISSISTDTRQFDARNIHFFQKTT